MKAFRLPKLRCREITGILHKKSWMMISMPSKSELRDFDNRGWNCKCKFYGFDPPLTLDTYS